MEHRWQNSMDILMIIYRKYMEIYTTCDGNRAVCSDLKKNKCQYNNMQPTLTNCINYVYLSISDIS